MAKGRPERPWADESPVEEVKGILAVVSEKVPAGLRSLADVLRGEEQAAKYGEAVAGFNKTLKDGGITDEQAWELMERYISAMKPRRSRRRGATRPREGKCRGTPSQPREAR